MLTFNNYQRKFVLEKKAVNPIMEQIYILLSKNNCEGILRI